MGSRLKIRIKIAMTTKRQGANPMAELPNSDQGYINVLHDDYSTTYPTYDDGTNVHKYS